MEKPTLPKGTRDFGPAVMAKRQFILDSIKSVFQKFGFQPLETPAMENLDTLMGKYGDEGDQLLFKILNNGDFLSGVDSSILDTRNTKLLTPAIAEKGLRYDLTVPFARYVVMNRHEISLPFRRYQVQPVWRADRPQKGRYREFYQCDADVVGTDSLICEAEIVLMIRESMQSLAIQDYSIKINHRGILNGVAEAISATGKENELFVAIDKLDKIGERAVREELMERGFNSQQLDNLFALLNISGSNHEKLSALQSTFMKSDSGQKGVRDIQEIFHLVKSYGESDTGVEFDIALARGLSYYTGCIFEVKINNVKIGSVSGGGRYDNLTQAFGSKERLSGVGISFGIDRIFDAMEELQLFPAQTKASTQVLVCHFDEPSRDYGFGILHTLRKNGIASEIYPEIARLKKQLDYANRKMIVYTIVIGAEEMQSGLLTIKHMESGDQQKLSLEHIIQKLPG
jgi:histidyl-tRNA synthetase